MYFLACCYFPPPLPNHWANPIIPWDDQIEPLNSDRIVTFMKIILNFNVPALQETVCKERETRSLCAKTRENEFWDCLCQPRCGLSFLKLKRDRNVTAVRKQPQPVPEIPLLCGSNRQEIRTRNSHRHLWLRLKHSRQEGKSMRSGVRSMFWLLHDLGQAFLSPEPQFSHVEGLAAMCTKCLLQDWA